MADQKESSVLFSLKELMNLEEDRIREEEAEKTRRAKAELDAKEAADRVARDAEEKRLREEEERRRQEENRKREEAAIVEAIRHGELEKARAEAEAKARLDTLAQQQAHEAQLAQIHRDSGKKRLQIIVGIVVVCLVGAVVGGGLAYKSSRDKAAQEAALLRQQQAEVEGKLAQLQAEIKASQEKEAALKDQLANAKSEADKARIQSELEKAEKATQDLRTRGGGGGRAPAGSGGGSKPSKPSAPKESNCAPGDPMCN